MAFQLDTGIPLSARGPQIANPLEVASAALQFRSQQEQHAAMQEQRGLLNQQRTLQLQKAEQDAAETATLRQLFGGEKPPTNEQIFAVVGPQRGTEIVKGLSALKTAEIKDYGELQKVIGSTLGGLSALPEGMRAEAYSTIRGQFVQRGWLQPDQVPEQYSPEFVSMAQQWTLSPKDQIELNKPTTHSVGGSLVQVGPGGKASTVYEAPEKPAETGSLADYMDSVAQGLGLKTGKQLNPRQRLQAKAQYEAAGRAPREDNEPLQAIMGPDGKPVLVRRIDAIGKAPASTREQGRQVTSGDAGTITEYDTALDDIGVLRKTLTETEGSTGVVSAAAAALPNWASGLVGWSDAPAKTRQAAIDRVKQVIGKALEGGVLRKEDELKYTKILPTISDSHTVAVGKIEGLEAAIKQRKSRHLDSLSDAGYDTSKFTSRQPAGGGLVTMQTPDGRTLQIPANMAAEAERRGARRIGQ